MRSSAIVLAVLLAIAVSFFAGYLVGEKYSPRILQIFHEDVAAPPPSVTHRDRSAREVSPVAATPEAREALIAAAKANNARAQYVLALDYKNGQDFPVDPAKAVQFMGHAADHNLAVAQRRLGVWYEEADGVKKDLARAASLYQKAAANGDYQAMHNLGYFYAQGLGNLGRDKKLAEKWFKEAAERGLVASQVNLAIVYSQEDANDQAYYWSAVAAKRDASDNDAPRMRDTFGPMLASDVKEKMDRAVASWRPTPVDLIANGGFDTSAEAFLPETKRTPLTTAEIRNVQKMLKDQGYDPGDPTGQISKRTLSAIKTFQAAYKLPVNGIADRELVAQLGAAPH